MAPPWPDLGRDFEGAKAEGIALDPQTARLNDLSLRNAKVFPTCKLCPLKNLYNRYVGGMAAVLHGEKRLDGC